MDDAPIRSRRPELVLAALASAAAAIAGYWVIRPSRPVLIGYDTTSSVVYFERIAHGEVLERFLGTTPKPLLTLVDGGLHAMTGDWRPIAWVALLVYALAIGAAVMLATRVSGPVAGGFVAASLVASRGLLVDLSQAYAVAWALLALCIAGLVVTGRSPRYVVAGVALAVGGLARQEVLLVSGVAALAVIGPMLLRLERTPPREARWLLIGLVALPLTGVHDLLLTGDAFYTLKVPAIGAAGHDLGGVMAAVAAITNHTVANLALVALAILGAVVLARDRAWLVLSGLGTIALGVSALVIVVGARGMIVLDRYAYPIELALILFAATGVAAMGAAILARVGGSRLVLALAIVASVAVALTIQPRIGPLDQATINRIEAERRAARDYAVLLPSLRAAVDAAPGLREPPDRRDPYTRATTGPTLLVSPRLLPQIVVDLELRLDRVVTVVGVDPDSTPLGVGSLVLHFARLDGEGVAAWAEVEHPTIRADRSLVPVDRVGARAWLIRVEP